MAKNKTPKGAKGMLNKHLHSRISYLYQAATYLSFQSTTGGLQKASSGVSSNGPDSGSLGTADEGIQDLLPTDARVNDNSLATSTELAPSISTKAVSSGLALQLGSHLRAVSLKGQVQLSQNVKRSICKCCNTILIPGRTSTTTVENNSRGGKKPWADVLLVECTTCGSKKRFPMGSKWQVRKTERSSAASSKSRSARNATAKISKPHFQQPSQKYGQAPPEASESHQVQVPGSAG